MEWGLPLLLRRRYAGQTAGEAGYPELERRDRAAAHCRRCVCGGIGHTFALISPKHVQFGFVPEPELSGEAVTFLPQRKVLHLTRRFTLTKSADPSPAWYKSFFLASRTGGCVELNQHLVSFLLYLPHSSVKGRRKHALPLMGAAFVA